MDIVVRNGIVAVRPDNMSEKFWNDYVAPRIGKSYGSRKKAFIFGHEYDIHYENDAKQTKQELTSDEMFGDPDDCVGCKI